MKKILVLLFFMLISCETKVEGVITSKIEEKETYWEYRHKQSDIQLDSVSFFKIKKLNMGNPRFYIQPKRYYFYIDGKERVEVSSYIFQIKHEGERVLINKLEE